MSAPGMAAAEAFDGEPASLEGAMLFYGFHTIGAAGRCVAAAGTQQRRYGQLIKADERGK